MKSSGKKKQFSTCERLSVLWIVVMFTMAFADILTFVLPEALNDMVKGTTDIKITQGVTIGYGSIRSDSYFNDIFIPCVTAQNKSLDQHNRIDNYDYFCDWWRVIISPLYILCIHRSNLHVTNIRVFVEMEDRRRYWQGIVDGSAVRKFLVKYRGFTVRSAIIPYWNLPKNCRRPWAGGKHAFIFSPCGVPAFGFSEDS